MSCEYQLISKHMVEFEGSVHLHKKTKVYNFYFSQVVVPKAKGEILGVVIVESGWGSMLPTIVLANLSPTGPAARCGQLNIGDQVRSGHCSFQQKPINF